MTARWLTDMDDEPEVGTIVATQDDVNWIHGAGTWISAFGRREDWETLAGELGPVHIVRDTP